MASMLKDIVTGCCGRMVGVMAHAGVAEIIQPDDENGGGPCPGVVAHVAFGVVTAAIVRSLGVRSGSGAACSDRNGQNAARDKKVRTREEIPATV